MPYTVYKVTNQITQDFYIGVHKTTNPQDTYLGSGTAIRQQVALHGPENFTKEILLITEVKREAYEKEAELVNPLLGTPGCLNIHPGGHGGFGYVNAKGLGLKGSRLGVKAGGYLRATARRQQLEAEDPEFAKRQRELRLKNMTAAREGGALVRATAARALAWTGQHHTDETRAKMSESKQGRLNNMYGTCWLHHPGSGEVLRVKREESTAWLAQGWIPGRKIKHGTLAETV